MMKSYICYNCGKEFERIYKTIFKLKVDKRTEYFCCYTCYNKVLKEIEDSKSKKNLKDRYDIEKGDTV